MLTMATLPHRWHAMSGILVTCLVFAHDAYVNLNLCFDEIINCKKMTILLLWANEGGNKMWFSDFRTNLLHKQFFLTLTRRSIPLNTSSWGISILIKTENEELTSGDSIFLQNNTIPGFAARNANRQYFYKHQRSLVLTKANGKRPVSHKYGIGNGSSVYPLKLTGISRESTLSITH